jgi:CrcB protein
VVNLAASFALGLITPLLGGCGHGLRIHLLLATGFLGSLSTFSSFVVEVLQSWMLRERRQSILLMAVSVFAGLMAVYVGASISG